MVTADPWTDITYTYKYGQSTTGVYSVQTGGAAADILGRAIIIHDYMGYRVACALLEPIPETRPARAEAFGPYMGYSGSLRVGGSVGPMVTTGVTQSFSYSLTGVDPACTSGPGSAGNSCGVERRPDSNPRPFAPLRCIPPTYNPALLRGTRSNPALAAHPQRQDVLSRCWRPLLHWHSDDRSLDVRGVHGRE